MIEQRKLEGLLVEARYSRGNRWTTEKLAAAILALEEGATPPVTFGRDELVSVLLDALHGTTVPAVPLADRILALVEPGVFDRGKARELLWPARDAADDTDRERRLLDALAGCVVPSPGGVLDRDKAREVIVEKFVYDRSWETTLDRLAACVVPDPRVAAALTLHQPRHDDQRMIPDCPTCGQSWPCATARALGATDA